MVALATRGMARARILIADDYPLMRAGLCSLIDEQPDLFCCAEAENSPGVWNAVADRLPDLLLLDLTLGSCDGLQLLKDLKVQYPGLKILVLTQDSDSLCVELALKAGALGFIDKEEDAQEILRAIRTVLAGEVYLTRAMAALFLNRVVRRPSDSGAAEHHPLSQREQDVMELLGAGLSTREIATRLNLSFKTIETHRENIKRKLGLRGAAELVHFAVRWAGQHVTFGPQSFA